MTELQYVSCHVHPNSLDSASTAAQFVKRAVEIGAPAIACTDHGSLAACKEVFDLATGKVEYETDRATGKKKFADLVPCLGLEAYLRDDACPILLRHGVPRTPEVVCSRCGDKWKDAATPRCKCGVGCGQHRETFRSTWVKYTHVTMGFRSYESYLCAVRLLTKADLHAERHGSERKPIFTWSDLEELGAHDTTMTSSCLIGAVSRHLLAHDDFDVAEAYYDRLRGMCRPGNFYAEVFPHKTDRNWVKGVTVQLEDGTTRKFHFGKKLRTNAGELEASALATDWGRRDNGSHHTLLAVKNFRVWQDEQPALRLVGVEAIEGFVENECRPWTVDGDLQRGCNEFALSLAAKYGDPVLIGDDAHYAHAEDSVIQDIRLAQSGSWRFWGKYHLQTSGEALVHFRETLGISDADFQGWVETSWGWAGGFKGFRFPSEPRLPTSFYPTDTGGHALQLIEQHGRMRWDDPVYVDRLRYELSLYKDNGKLDLLPYFFPEEEVCEFFAARGQLTGPGRGSAAGTLLAYLLEVTHADPIRYNLSIDRFITPVSIENGKIPDIDLDVPDREALLGSGGFLTRRFGDNFVQVSTETKLKLRSSVKDVHRALHRNVSADVEEMTKRFQQAPQGIDDLAHVNGYEANGGWVPGALEFDPALQEYVAKYPREWELVRSCLGLPRQKGRHASAFLIADVPVDHFIPLTEVGGVRVTSYTAKSVEAVGGVKYDFLGLTALETLSAAIQIIQARLPAPEKWQTAGGRVPRHRLVPVGRGWSDVWDLPDDQAVYSDIAEGRSETVFQFGSSGARQWMRHFNFDRPDGKPIIRSIMDLAYFTALDRPGPLDFYVSDPEDGSKHNILVEYARRARGLPPSLDVHPAVSQVLPETYGLMVTQEGMQRAYQEITGCTGAEAEEFRRAVAKKEMKKILAKFEPFVEQAAPKVGGIENARKIWESFSTFGQYAFNASHSVCYSIIGYACAYLKHHYPLEWWCAVLRSATKEEVADSFWAHAGHLVDLPDVRHSGDTFEIQGGRIRAPLSLIDGIGPVAHEQIEAARPFADIEDFARKMRASEARAVHRGVVYKLILAGVLDALFPAGADTFDQLLAYEVVLAQIATEEAGPTATGRPRKPKVPVPVDGHYASLSPLERYQLRKQVLPVYSEPLAPLVPSRRLSQSRTGDWYLFDEGGDPTAVSDKGDVEEAEHRALRGKGIRLALVAYVQAAREFVYGVGKRAREVVLDFDGGRQPFVYWARKDGRDPSELAPGAVLGVWIYRRDEAHGFSVADWVVLAPPLASTEERTATEPRVWSAKGGAPADAVDVGRPSRWGNAYSHLHESAAYKTRTVEEAVRAHEAHVRQQPQLVADAVRELSGRHLACPCAPKKGLGPHDGGGYRCHGQVWLRIVAEKVSGSAGAKRSV